MTASCPSQLGRPTPGLGWRALPLCVRAPTSLKPPISGQINCVQIICPPIRLSRGDWPTRRPNLAVQLPMARTAAFLSSVAVAIGALPAPALALGLVPDASRAGPPPHRCEPSISSVDGLWAPTSNKPIAIIQGTCFGRHIAFFDKDSMYFRVTDLGPNGTVAELGDPADGPKVWWSACSTRHDAVNGNKADAVTCTITSWTNTSITLQSFDYARIENAQAEHTSPPTTVPPTGIRPSVSDVYAIQVWNPENRTGPAIMLAQFRLALA